MLHIIEPILLVHEGERLDEHEDKGIAEPTEKGEDKDDWFCEEHLERSTPCNQDLFGGKSVFERHEFIRSPNIEAWIGLTSLFSNVVHHNRSPRLRDREEMKDLDKSPKDKLNPDGPSPVKELLHETTDNGAEYRASYGGEHNVGNGVLLSVGFKNIGNHTQGDRTTCRRKTA